MAISLVKIFNASTTYVADHESNYTAIESAINSLQTSVQGQAALSGTDQRVNELYDRNGIFGKASYKPVAATLSAAAYNLTIAAGAYWSGAEYRKNASSTLISMAAMSTATHYVNVPTGGVPTVTTSAGADTVWQFEYDSTTHVVSAVTFYSSTADILLDGDDWAATITGYDSLDARLDAIEASGSGISTYYAEDSPNHSGLNFAYKAGKCRDNNTVSTTNAGTILLTNATTNYIELTPSTGVVSTNTTSYTSAKVPLFTVVTSGGAISTVTDHRTWALSTGSGSGHAQNTDTGTDNNEFKLNNDVVGTPSQDCALVVERGTSPDVKIRWNETNDAWEFTNDGTNYTEIGSGGADLGSQELSKYVAIEDPALILEELSQSTGGGYTQVDLGPTGINAISDAPQGVQALVFRVAFWDSAPSSTVNAKFRKYGSILSPAKSYTVWGGTSEHSGYLSTLVIPGDNGASPPTIGYEWLITASGAGTANLRVWLCGYFAKVTGVGTQTKTKTYTGNTVNAASNQTFNKTAWVNRGLVYNLTLTETGGTSTGTYDVEVYKKDTFLAADLLYKAVAISSTANSRVYTDRLPWMYLDSDSTSELHIKIINNDGAQNMTFTIAITAEQFL